MNEKRKLNRREALLGSIYRLIESANPVATEKGNRLFSDPAYAKNEFKGSEFDDVNLRSAELNFLNIGVSHDPSKLPRQIEYTPLIEVIKSADILLLEVSGHEGYFDLIGKFASQDAEILNIDRSHTLFSDFLGHGIDTYIVLSTPSLIIETCKSIGEQPLDLFKKFVKKFALMQYGVLTPMFFDFFINSQLGNIVEEEILNKPVSISHVGDGRSIFMTLDIKQMRATFPDKKIVAVTGDGHAIAINEYLTTKEGQRVFKEYIYQIFYGWLKTLPKTGVVPNKNINGI